MNYKIMKGGKQNGNKSCIKRNEPRGSCKQS